MDNSDITLNVCTDPSAVKEKKKERSVKRRPVIRKTRTKIDLLERPEFTFKWDNPGKVKQNAQVFNIKTDKVKNPLRFPSYKDINRYMRQAAAGEEVKDIKQKNTNTAEDTSISHKEENDNRKAFKRQGSELEKNPKRFKSNGDQNTGEEKDVDSNISNDIQLGTVDKIAKVKSFKNKKNFELKSKTSSKIGNRNVSSLFGNNPNIPNIGQRLVRPVIEEVFSGSTFSELPIHPYSVSNLSQNLDITTLTNVQKKAIPLLLEGNDVLIRSQTGSGKTLAYALPIIEALQSVRPKLSRSDGIRALIIVPTRELALQTYELLLKLIKPFTWIVPGYLVGGEKRKAEKARLRRGITVLVGTPGRILDHVKNTTSLKLGSVRCLILDEADRMLDMGYEKDIRSLVEALKSEMKAATYNPLALLKSSVSTTVTKSKQEEQNISTTDEEGTVKTVPLKDFNSQKLQTVLLSATLTHAVEQLAGLTLENPLFVDTSDTDKSNNNSNIGENPNDSVLTEEMLVIPDTVIQSYIITPPKLRLVALSSFIIGKVNKSCKMIIFMATQDMVDFHTELLTTVLVKGDVDKVDDDENDSDAEKNNDYEDIDNSDSDDEGVRKSLIDVQFFKLHGSMTQKERTDVFKTFRAAKLGILLCTDVAARGLDLPRVDCVVQYTGPTSASDYVHRVGRTARAGQRGDAVIFLAPHEVLFVRQLEDRRIRLKQEQIDLNNVLAVLDEVASVEIAATTLQQSFESTVLQSKRLKQLASKAYLSWVRFYSTYPRDMRSYFNRKEVHLGHYAKSFALRDPPTTIGGQQKGAGYSKHGSNKKRQGFGKSGVDFKKNQLGFGNKSGKMGRAKRLVVSEYSSGLEPKKKKNK